jgi:hypothetical protein
MIEAGHCEPGQRWRLCQMTVDKLSWVPCAGSPELMAHEYVTGRVLVGMHKWVVAGSIYFH